MGFTTPCFIRKNTPELRKKLEELGYKQVKQAIYYNCIMVEDGNIWSCNNIFNPAKADGKGWKECIDCGTNEPLFLAIAALRDGTDKNQWFVLDHDNIWEAVGCYQYKGDFILCNHDRWYCGTDVAQAHKATVKELQELFSQKIQVPQIEWNINDVINKD